MLDALVVYVVALAIVLAIAGAVGVWSDRRDGQEI